MQIKFAFSSLIVHVTVTDNKDSSAEIRRHEENVAT